MALTLSPTTETRTEQNRGSSKAQAETAVWSTLVAPGLEEGLAALAVSPLMSKLREVFIVSPFEQDQAFAQLSKRDGLDISSVYSELAKGDFISIDQFTRQTVASSLSDFLVNAA
jgi:hypothetical protein